MKREWQMLNGQQLLLREKMIHNSSIIDKKAKKFIKNVKIGPFCFVGPNVEIFDNVELVSNVHIEGNTKIGKDTKIYPIR